MSEPHQINTRNLAFARNIGITEGILTAILAIGGINFLVPLTFTIICAAVYFGGNIYNKRQLAAANRHPELTEAEKKDLAIKSWAESKDAGRGKCLSDYDCPNYDQIIFEMKLVEEGIIDIQEIETCDVSDCLLCPRIKKNQKEAYERAAEEARRAKQLEHEKAMAEIYARQRKRATENDNAALAKMSKKDAERVRAYRSAKMVKLKVNTCPNHGKSIVETWFVDLCPTCRLDALKEQDKREREAERARKRAEEEEKKRLEAEAFERRRHVHLNGLSLVRPLEVPEGAVPSFFDASRLDPFATHSYIVWKWTEPDGVTIKAYKQPVVVDHFAISADDEEVQRFGATYDEDGNYLGDYNGLKADWTNK